MKLLTLLLGLLLSFASLAQSPPVTIKGQWGVKQTAKWNLQFPNNSVTNMGGIDALISYCGDVGNILANCGFEAPSPLTSWNYNAATTPVVSTDYIAGKKSVYTVAGASIVEVYQDSTLYAGNFNAGATGVAGTISAWIKNDAPNMYFCQRAAGAWVKHTDGVNITDCKLISQRGAYDKYELPVTFGGTDNGAGVVSLTPSTAAIVATSGTTYYDHFSVAIGQKFTYNSNTGPWETCTITGSWTANTTYTCKSRQNGQNRDFDVGVSITGAVTAANLTLTLPNSWVMDVNNMSMAAGKNILSAGCWVVDTGTQSYPCMVYDASTTTVAIQAVGASGTYTTAGTSISNTVPATWGNTDYAKILFSVPIVGLNASAASVSQPADSFSTDSNTFAHKTTAIVAGDAVGTYNTWSYTISSNTKALCATPPTVTPSNVNGILIYTRAYNAASTCNLPARYDIKIAQAGTPLVVNAELYKAFAKATSGSLVAGLVGAFTADAGARVNQYEESTGIYSIDAAFRTAAVTSAVFEFSDNTVAATSGYVVINAQKKKDWVVGEFSELDKTPNVNKPKWCHYKFGGAASTLAAPVNCTTGTCIEVDDSCQTGSAPAWATTSLYQNLTFASGTFSNSSPLDCRCTAYNTSAGPTQACQMYFDTGDQTWASNSSGGAVLNIYSSVANGTQSVGYVSLSCKGQAP